MPLPTTHLSYRKDIDGLRAVAVLAVVLFHAVPRALPSGFIGVDIFFVISGFLISTIILENLEHSQFTYVDFYSRRIKRIFPALLLVLFTAAIAGWFLLSPEEYGRLGKHLLQSTLFLENINLIRESGYFDYSADMKPLLHLWSLAVEEQFYILWPLVLGLFFKRKRLLLSFLCLLFAVSFFINVHRAEEFPISTFFELQARLWELATGGIFAFLFSYNPFVRSALERHRHFFSICGALLLALGFLLIDRERIFPGWFALLPVFGSVFLIAAGEKAVLNRHILSQNTLVKIGLISYPLYLWHWLLLAFARILLPGHSLNERPDIRAAAVTLSFILAFLTYRYIERFFKKAPPTFNLKIGALVMASVLVGFFGWQIEEHHGFPERFTGKTVDGNDHSSPVPVVLVPCKNVFLRGVETCVHTEDSFPDKVIAIGDSHASALGVALAPYYAAKKKNLTVIGSTCTLGLMDVGTVTGKNLTSVGVRNINAAFEWAIAQRPETIILVSDNSFYFEGVGLPTAHMRFRISDLLNPTEENHEIVFMRAMEKTLRRLETEHIKVVYVLDNPELSFFPKEACFERPVNIFGVQPLSPCAEKASAVHQRQKNYRNAVAKVLKHFPNVKTFDPTAHVCDETYCYARRDGPLLYSDDNHFSPHGALWLSQFFDF